MFCMIALFIAFVTSFTLCDFLKGEAHFIAELSFSVVIASV